MKYLTLILSLALLLGLSGCSDDKPVRYVQTQPQYQQQYAQPQQYAQQPQYVQQPGYNGGYQQDNGIGMGSVLAAGVAGAVLGNIAGDKGHSITKTVTNATSNVTSSTPAKSTVSPLAKPKQVKTVVKPKSWSTKKPSISKRPVKRMKRRKR